MATAGPTALDAFAEALRARLAPSMARLERVWLQLGLQSDDAAARRGEVAAHLSRLLGDMASEEERQRDEIVQSVAESRARIAALERELGSTPSSIASPQQEDSPLLLLEVELQDRCDALEAEREHRLEEKVDLERRAEQLRGALVIEADAHILGSDDDISAASMQRLRELVGSYEKQLAARRAEATPLVQQCQTLMAALGDDPIGGLEAQVLQGIDALTLSPATMVELRALQQQLETRHARLQDDVKLLYHQIEELWNDLEVPAAQRTNVMRPLGGNPANLPGTGDAMRHLRTEMRRLHELRRERLPAVFAKRMPDLVSWWDQCFVSKEERAEFILQLGLPYPLEPAEAQDILRRHEAPDKLLQALDDERLRCQELMRQQGDLFKAVAAIETYRSTIANVTDEDRLRNRGGLLERLKKMEKAATAAEKKIADWEANTGKQFIKDGAHYLTYLHELQDEEKRRQHQDQEERRRRHEEEVQHEMKYGAVPATPKRIKRNGTADATAIATPRSTIRRGNAAASNAVSAAPSTISVRGSVKAAPARSASKTAASRAPLADANTMQSGKKNNNHVFSRDSLSRAKFDLGVVADSSMLMDQQMSILSNVDEFKLAMEQGSRLHSTNLNPHH